MGCSGIAGGFIFAIGCPVGVGQPNAPASEERFQEPDGLQVGSIVRSDLFSARRCCSKERARSGSLGSDMAAP
jgi:hypothetical protein